MGLRGGARRSIGILTCLYWVPYAKDPLWLRPVLAAPAARRLKGLRSQPVLHNVPGPAPIAWGVQDVLRSGSIDGGTVPGHMRATVHCSLIRSTHAPLNL